MLLELLLLPALLPLLPLVQVIWQHQVQRAPALPRQQLLLQGRLLLLLQLRVRRVGQDHLTAAAAQASMEAAATELAAATGRARARQGMHMTAA